MTKRKAYAKPCIAVEDFVLNQFIAASCGINMRDTKAALAEMEKIPLYADMLKSGYFATGIQDPCNLYISQYDDTLCYHTQGGARGVLINS